MTNDNGRYKKKPIYQYDSNQMVVGKDMRSSSKHNNQKISSQSSRNKVGMSSMPQNKNYMN